MSPVNPIHAVFAALLSWFLLTRVRRTVSLVLIGTTCCAIPAQAQLGIPAIVGAAAAVVSYIVSTIGPILDGIINVVRAIATLFGNFRSLWERVVYPLDLIAQARTLAGSLITTFRSIFNSLSNVAVNSASLANPIALERLVRNRSTADFAALDAAFEQVYRALPPPPQLSPFERDLIDMDDATAKALLKTLKAADRASALTVGAAEEIEEEARLQAPGSAAYLAGGGITGAIRSQAVMMRMISAEIRQEAAKLAHDNARRKRSATFAEDLRRAGADVLRRP